MKYALIVAMLVAAGSEVLKEEPFAGMLQQGQTVLVDNGKCPAGQVQQVTGGARGRPREYKCVPRP